jgi:hypothetical protein
MNLAKSRRFRQRSAAHQGSGDFDFSRPGGAVSTMDRPAATTVLLV